MVKVSQLGAAAPATNDVKGRIVSFMTRASTEISPSEESRLPELKSLLPAGAAVFVAHTPNASFGQVVHAALAVRRAGFLATPHIAVRRVPNAEMLRAALADLRAGGVEEKKKRSIIGRIPVETTQSRQTHVFLGSKSRT